MTQAVQKECDWYATNFKALEKRFPSPEGSSNGNSPRASLDVLRRSAYASFDAARFPTTRLEDWRYTDVSRIARTPFRLPAGEAGEGVTQDTIDARIPASLARHALVFVNGRFAANLSRLDSLPPGLSAGSLESLASGGASPDRECLLAHLATYARYEGRPFVALNTAFLADGAFIRVARGATVEEPVHVIFVNASRDPAAATATHPRLFVFAERDSEATVVETYLGLDESIFLTNPVGEVHVSEGARLDHVRLQLENRASFHVASLDVHQEGNSTYRSLAFSFGAALMRNDLRPVLDGEGCETTLNGLYVLGGDQHSDTHTIVDHAKPHCNSTELYKGVLADASHGVFSGKIVVRKDAQKTNAIQSNRNLLLSPDATIDSKPQLVIYADDVKCTHGATVGQLDENALFYLRSRGIGKEQARRMLIQAFAVELVAGVRHVATREFVERLLLSELEAKA